MKIEEKLELLRYYYIRTPGVGHSATMMQGLYFAKQPIVIVGNHHHGKAIKDKHPTANCITVNSISDRMQGYRDPLIFDNDALFILFGEALDEIRQLKKKLEEESVG